MLNYKYFKDGSTHESLSFFIVKQRIIDKGQIYLFSIQIYRSILYYHNTIIISSMPKNIIEVLSDEEEDQLYKAKADLVLKRQLHHQASLMRSNTGVMLSLCKNSIIGTEEEKQERIARRVQRMFMDRSKLNEFQQYYCLKRDPTYTHTYPELQLQAIMLFGTDFWTSKQIRKEGQQISIIPIIYCIDRSHKILQFKNHNESMSWLKHYIQDPQVLRVKNQQGFQEQQLQNKLKGWFKLKSHGKLLKEARFCTIKQKNIPQLVQQTKNANYSKFKEAIDSEMQKLESIEVRRVSRRFGNSKILEREQHRMRNVGKRQPRRRKQREERIIRQESRSRNKNKVLHKSQICQPSIKCKGNEILQQKEKKNVNRTEIYYQNSLDFLLENQSEKNEKVLNEIENAFEKMYLNHDEGNLSVEMGKKQKQVEISPNDLSLLYQDKIPKEGYKRKKSKKRLFEKEIEGAAKVGIEEKYRKRQEEGFDYQKYVDEYEKKWDE